MPVIVQQGAGAYAGRMREALTKLLLMLAVLAMPFGMAAPAAAAAHHAMPVSAMPMQHCPDQSGSSHGIGGECTMACAATLPAVSLSAQEHIALVPIPAPRALAAPLLGLHPDTETPPPRFS